MPGPMQIVAPQIHCLKLRNTQLPCTLVDVSSLTEAEVLDIIIFPVNLSYNADFLHATMLEMLKKLKNVEKLTFSGSYLQVCFTLILAFSNAYNSLTNFTHIGCKFYFF